MNYKVYVIIVTYNGQQWYRRCFESLRALETAVNVVVVDNSPNEETADFVRTNYPEIHLIKTQNNLGFGGANNLGLKYAVQNGADYVFLLNQDAWFVEKNTVNELIRIHRENPYFGILSPVHVNQEENGIEKLLLNRIDDWRVTDSQLINDLYFNKLRDIYETKYINAAAWCIPRSTLDIIGGFDPIFFHYGEDDNYLNRLFYNGLKLGICPCLRIIHDSDRPRPLYESREQEVLWLIEYTDINKNIDLNKEIRNCRQKILTNILKMNKKRAEHWLTLLNFLQKNKTKIQVSRTKNIAKGENYLT
jgi:GT2 family glycosyltransferase